ncbi:MAG TPA: hypothetical protein DEQ64_08885 [Lachnoclostridium sp.]|uniref:hypothetical protein n=1 Tax=Lacrimispora sp. TaxID=2719234 RepID=UPI000EEE2E6C|nr:hypothetical protein [Lacrimispora sp.]HCD43832.1 hypothetical protein [Lachnoclostridium sp.]
MNAGWVKPILRIKDVEKLRETVKVGDKITLKPTMEKVVIIEKFPYLLRIENLKWTQREIRTISYKELLFNNMGLIYNREEKE